MRIVNRQTFLALPAGTVYSEYDPAILRGLMIKGRTIYGLTGSASEGVPIDHYEQDILQVARPDDDPNAQEFETLDRAHRMNQPFAMDLSCECREGLYDDTTLYAVYERADVAQLIARLQGALAVGYRT